MITIMTVAVTVLENLPLHHFNVVIFAFVEDLVLQGSNPALRGMVISNSSLSLMNRLNLIKSAVYNFCSLYFQNTTLQIITFQV